MTKFKYIIGCWFERRARSLMDGRVLPEETYAWQGTFFVDSSNPRDFTDVQKQMRYGDFFHVYHRKD